MKKITIALVVGIAGFFLAALAFTIKEATLVGLIAFLVTLKTNEGLPLGVVSLLPIILFPAFDILSTSETSLNYSKSIIFLFLGGFFLAIAVEKTGLHKVIANKILSIFPSTLRGIIFSLAITSGVLSSFLSNTTTTLLLMPLALLMFFVVSFVLSLGASDVKIHRDKTSYSMTFEIIFLFGAGFSIAAAFTSSGLANSVASYLLDLTSLHPVLIMFAIAAMVTFTTEVTSNTALISMMLPILYAVTEASNLDTTLFLMIATICASYAFMLPIATPPNAIAMSSGVVHVGTMARYGFLLNIIGIILIAMIASFVWSNFI